MNIAPLLRAIDRWSADMGGVFSAADLANLIGRPSPLATARAIRRLVADGVIQRAQRGMFVTPAFDPWILAGRLVPTSYISMDSVLGRNGLIGTVPAHTLSVVATMRRPSITVEGERLRFFTIADFLLFGFVTESTGVRVADAEKAYIDLLYFYAKGRRFVIDPRNEVIVEKLNRKKILSYLKVYRNPRFAAFVKGCIHADA